MIFLQINGTDCSSVARILNSCILADISDWIVGVLIVYKTRVCKSESFFSFFQRSGKKLLGYLAHCSMLNECMCLSSVHFTFYDLIFVIFILFKK